MLGQKILAPSVSGAWVTGFTATDGENTYEYSGDLVIDLDFEDGSIAEMLDGDYPFEKGDGYIEIAGVRYDKVKK